MRGMALTALLVLLFVCRTMNSEERGECHICEAEHGTMKEFFDCWSARPGVEPVVIPKAFNWIIKRQLRKEMEGAKCGANFIRLMTEGVESFSLLDYGKLDGKGSLELEEELEGIAGSASANPDFHIIFSVEDIAGDSYSSLVFHSKASKAFIILRGKFSKDICTKQFMP